MFEGPLQDVIDEFSDMLTRRMSGLRVGDGMADEITREHVAACRRALGKGADVSR